MNDDSDRTLRAHRVLFLVLFSLFFYIFLLMFPRDTLSWLSVSFSAYISSFHFPLYSESSHLC